MKYTSEQLIDRVKGLHGFTHIPKYLLIGVRSKADNPNKFDDKFYLFIDGKFVCLATGTTNPGATILQNGWKKYNKLGAAIIKSDTIYYDVYKKSNGATVRHHNGRTPCFRQVKDMLYYRDGNNNAKSEEIGVVIKGNFSTNFHPAKFGWGVSYISNLVNNWSAGCQVPNKSNEFELMYKAVEENIPITYALLKEF